MMVSFPASMLAALPDSMLGGMLGRIPGRWKEYIHRYVLVGFNAATWRMHSLSPESLLSSLVVFPGYGCVRIAKVIPKVGKSSLSS